MITALERAKKIDLGSGSLCCDLATGGTCYEHQAIAMVIQEAVWAAIHERYSQAIEGHIYISVREFTSELDPHIRRYYDEFMNLDSGWGFWDEASHFHAGYHSPGAAMYELERYAEAL